MGNKKKLAMAWAYRENRRILRNEIRKVSRGQIAKYP